MHACVGGKSITDDIQVLQSGVHVAVGTPGRLCNMLHRKFLCPSHIKMLVLDDADEVLSRGFKDQVQSEITDTIRNYCRNLKLPTV